MAKANACGIFNCTRPNRMPPARGKSKATFISIKNEGGDAMGDIRLRVTDVDSYDWDGNSRPEELNGVVIGPGMEIRARLERNTKSKYAAFKLHVERKDGTSCDSYIASKYDMGMGCKNSGCTQCFAHNSMDDTYNSYQYCNSYEWRFCNTWVRWVY